MNDITPPKPEDTKPPTKNEHRKHSHALEPGQAVHPQSAKEQQAEQAAVSAAAHDHSQYNKDLNSLRQTTVEDIDETDQPEKKRSIIKELLIWAGVTIAIVFIIQNFIFQAFYVSGNSMEPQFHNNDYLIISKLPITSYDIGKLFGQKNMNIRRGDVLVFRYPNAPETFFIKRALALPGDRITVKDGVITVYNQQHPEGLVLKEDYIDPAFVTEGNIDEVVEEGKVFVVGDNRSSGGSFDSRAWGQLPQSFITGFVNLRLLPVNNLKLNSNPIYE